MEILQESSLIDQPLLLEKKKIKQTKKVKNKFNSKLVTKRIIIISLFSSLSVVIRLIFAPIQGIEVSTFLLLSFALFIPLKDATIIGMITVFLSSLILGFGTWTVVQLIYYPLSILLIWCLKPILNNRWTFMIVLAFFSGPWVVFWYFLSDLVFFGFNLAYARLFLAIPVCFIQIASNVLAAIFVTVPMAKVFKYCGHIVYGSYYKFKTFKTFDFKNILNITILLLFAICSTGAIVLFFKSTWYFAKVSQNIEWKGQYEAISGVLDEKSYNELLNSLNANQTAIVTIYGNAKIVCYVENVEGKTLAEIITDKTKPIHGKNVYLYYDYDSKIPNNIFLTSVNIFRVNPLSVTTQITKETYGSKDLPPFIYDKTFTIVGASYFRLKNHSVYQLSYDIKRN